VEKQQPQNIRSSKATANQFASTGNPSQVLFVDNRDSWLSQFKIIQRLSAENTPNSREISQDGGTPKPAAPLHSILPLQRVELVRNADNKDEKFHLPEKGEKDDGRLVKIYTHNMGLEEIPWGEIEPRLHNLVSIEIGMLDTAEKKEIEWTPSGEYKPKSREDLFEYSLDGLGRTVEVYAFIDRITLRDLKGSSVSSGVKKKLQAMPGWREGKDNGGHIVGNQFGGSGTQIKNVVMQDADQNTQFATRYEDPIEIQIRGQGQADVRWGVEYYGDSWRPSLMSIQAIFPNGKVMGGGVTNPPSETMMLATQLKEDQHPTVQLLRAKYSEEISAPVRGGQEVVQCLTAVLESGREKEIHLMKIEELQWVIEHYNEESLTHINIRHAAQSALDIEQSKDLKKLEGKYRGEWAYLQRLKRRFKAMDPNYRILSLINIVYRVGIKSAIPDFKDWLAFFAQTKEKVEDEEFLDFIVELRSAETLIDRDMDPRDQIAIGEDNQVGMGKSFDQKIIGGIRTRNVEIKHVRAPIKDTNPIWNGIEHAAEKWTKGLRGTVEAMVILRFYRTPDNELDIEPIYKGDGIYSSTGDTEMQSIQKDLQKELEDYQEVDVIHLLSDDTDRYWKFIRTAKKWDYEEI